MHYKFRQTVKIADKIFKTGIQEVSDEVESHPDFLHFVRCGWIEDAPEEKVVAQPVAVTDVAKRMAARIEKKLAANKKRIEQAREQVREPEEFEEQPDDEAAVEDEQQLDAELAANDDLAAEEVITDDVEPVHEQVQEQVEEKPLTPAQKAQATKKANAAKRAAEGK